jgi:hypothetical protein
VPFQESLVALLEIPILHTPMVPFQGSTNLWAIHSLIKVDRAIAYQTPTNIQIDIIVTQISQQLDRKKTAISQQLSAQEKGCDSILYTYRKCVCISLLFF